MEETANERLRTILGEDYDEESMQKMIGHAINTLIPDKVEELKRDRLYGTLYI